jgi:KUP system potassium uptake protein
MSAHDEAHKPAFTALALSALGVVFGDIGTSPLYTLKECLHASAEATGHHLNLADVYGLLSLIFWSLLLVVTVKYITFIMKADFRGEGGIFALLGLVPESQRKPTEGRLPWVAILVVVGAALLYGDGVITPAISVLSAVEGIGIAKPELANMVVPITCAILIGLFSIQFYGTELVGRLFGPVMLMWFGTIALLGIWHLSHHPEILKSLSPHHAFGYFQRHGMHGGLVLGSVVLAVTGGEALYADMGHFGIAPIRAVWLWLVFPALLLCYFGQGALVLADPAAAKNPFYAMVPTGGWTIALVILSSLATIIASQALISGAFSLTRQAMHLGYFPRVTIKHTAHHSEGQIYIPEINWMLAIGCLFLVLTFQSSAKLASAYGIAVTGTMVITSLVFYVVTRETWGWSRLKAGAVLALFLAIDVPFFAANTVKLADGGWVPVAIGIVLISAMLIWNKGRTLMAQHHLTRLPTLQEALPIIESRVAARVPGTAVFLASSPDRVPAIMLHQIERMRVLHENVVLMTIQRSFEPVVESAQRVVFSSAEHGIYRVIACYGYMETPDVPALVEAARAAGFVKAPADEVTYFLGRENILASDAGAMKKFPESIFAFLQRNSISADKSFGIPAKQVVEMGVQIDL